MFDSLNVFIAFSAGLISFLSPCVLPLVPGIVAYLAGESSTHSPSRVQTFVASVWFVCGFTIVFAGIGIALNTVLASVAYDAQLWLSRISGALIIIFGLQMMRVVRISFLEKTHTMHVPTGLTSRHVTAWLFGAAFAIGWTPCAGAALGAIVGLAAHTPHIAFMLLMSYAAGLGLPFLAIGLVARDITTLLTRTATYTRVLTQFFGALLVLIGVLILTQKLAQFAPTLPF
jgi:cytochrome c-type biogenesis protein